LTHRNQKWIVIIAALLLIAASRFTRLDDLAMNPDEIWSAWQTLGTPTQILQWTPYDWPPLYYLTLGAWRELTSDYPTTLRVFSALAFMIGAACTYRLMRQLYGESAGILSMLAYVALGYNILLSIEVRGYALLLGLMPLALWLTIRYFDFPGWRRAFLLGITLAAMVYTSMTSVGAVAMLGIYTLVVYRRAIWRWWLPAITAAILALPEIIVKASIAVNRVKATGTLTPLPFFQALGDLFYRYTGNAVLIWALIFIVAIILIVYRRGLRDSRVIALALWVIAMPVLLYILNPILGFFSARYAWWVMIGIALWAGLGLSYLPKIGTFGAGVLLIGLAFYPLPTTGEYNIWATRSPLAENFEWLRDHLHGGDIILADPANECGSPDEWDYYLRAYFPNSLQFVDHPQGYRRLWYVLFDGRQNSAIQQALDVTHIPGAFVGPPRCLFRLYEAPPNENGIAFENGMRFHGADVMVNGIPWSGPIVRHEGETARLRLWWSADHPIDRDYSVGLYLLREDGNRILAQNDSAPQLIFPQNAPQATSQWSPGGYYVEERDLALPYPTRDGQYELDLAVYYWEDQARIPAPGVNTENLVFLKRLTVKAY
jgi:Dolichyl-phosphate-mannose-protein mannosyltransferase